MHELLEMSKASARQVARDLIPRDRHLGVTRRTGTSTFTTLTLVNVNKSTSSYASYKALSCPLYFETIVETQYTRCYS